MPNNTSDFRNLVRPAVLETLEARNLLHGGVDDGDGDEVATPIIPIAPGTSQVSGYVVNDANKDGKWSTGEAGIKSRQVWIDINNDGTIDDVEPVVTTASNGKYIFSGIATGKYNIRQVVPDGWTQTSPASGAALVASVAVGQLLSGKDFCTTQGTNSVPTPNPTPTPTPDPTPAPTGAGTSTFSGYVVKDTNKDGKWSAGESGIAGRTVYIDSNNNSIFDDGDLSQLTSGSGKYTFAQMPAGTYSVRQALPDGWVQTRPAKSNALVVKIAAKQTLGGNDFTSINDGSVTLPPTPPPNPNPDPNPTPPPTPTPTGSSTFTGYVVNDTNKDGKWSSGEGGIAGRTVYIDSNNSGTLDTGELAQVTSSNGKYSFSQIAPGTYTVRQIVPDGWVQTKPINGGAFTVKIADKQTLAGYDFTTFNDGSVPATPVPGGSAKVSGWVTKTALPQARSEMFGETVNGKLYVFGGYYDQTFAPTSAANVFDPVTNTWSKIASLPTALTHTAHATDGSKIYFVGGYPGRFTDAGGVIQEYATSDARFYDTQTDTYGTLPSLPVGRGSGAMALLGRTLYFTGGTSDNRVDHQDSYKLDLDNQDAGWQTFAPLPVIRNHPAAVAMDGYVYFLTGQTDQDAQLTTHNEMWRYNPVDDTWLQMASLDVPRSHVTSSTFIANGKIITLGGEKAHLSPIANVDSYDPATDTWTRIGTMPDIGRYSGVAGMLDAKTLIYAGGFTTYFRNTVWTALIT